MLMLQTPRPFILATLFASIIPLQTALAFDLVEAVYTETILRSAAIACTDESFARKFISQSKAQVAFDLQGDGPIDAQQIENIITDANNRFDLAYSQEKCASIRPQLEALYAVRKETLLESKQLAEELSRALREAKAYN